MEVAEGAGDEALTATAILLFGPGGMELPGGYDTNEMSRWGKGTNRGADCDALQRNGRIGGGVAQMVVKTALDIK